MSVPRHLARWAAISRKESTIIKRLKEPESDNVPRMKKSDGILGVLRQKDFPSTSSNYACPLEVIVSNDDWENISRQLERPLVSASEKRQDILRTHGVHEKNGLMLACCFEPTIDVVKLLVKYGGKEALTARCICGNNALHYACWSNASYEVIEYLLMAGGLDTLLSTNTKHENALHTLCTRYTEDSLSDIIKLFIYAGKDEVVTAINNKGDLPIMSLLERAGDLPVKAITVYLDEWCDVQESNTASSSTEEFLFQDDVTNETNSDHVEEAFNNALQQLQKASDDDMGEILTTKFMKKYISDKFIHPLPIAILMMDLYAQILVVCVFSFLINNQPPHQVSATGIIVVIIFCITWRLTREVMQLATSALGDYLGSVSNTLDLLQILALLYGVTINFNDDFSERDRAVLVGSIFVAWIELLFELANLIRSMAIFVSAMFMIIYRMSRFMVTIITLSIMFAHMYHTAGPNNRDICFDAGNLTAAEFDEQGGWTCTLADSYSTTFMKLLAFDIPSGVPKWISLPYAILMVILFFNIIIAEIWTAYDDVMNESEKEFWSSRYDVIAELDDISELASRCPFNLSAFGGFAKHDDASDEEDERYDFNFLLEFRHWHEMKGDEKDFFQWWYGKSNSTCPPLKARLSFFFRKSAFKDIIFPASVFENVLFGRNRFGEVEVFERPFVLLLSSLLMIVSVALVIICFIGGLFSFGLLWPKAMRRQMFMS